MKKVTTKIIIKEQLAVNQNIFQKTIKSEKWKIYASITRCAAKKNMAIGSVCILLNVIKKIHLVKKLLYSFKKFYLKIILIILENNSKVI